MKQRKLFSSICFSDKLLKGYDPNKDTIAKKCTKTSNKTDNPQIETPFVVFKIKYHSK